MGWEIWTVSLVIFKNKYILIILNVFRFLGTLRGHVQAVYMICWSVDSRLLVSGSADSTLKGILKMIKSSASINVFCFSLGCENQKITRRSSGSRR